MTTKTLRSGTATGAGPDVRDHAAADAFFSLFEPYIDSGEAFWFQAGGPEPTKAAHYVGGGDAIAASKFRLYDRASSRVMVPSALDRHPLIRNNDGSRAAPFFAFGAGGVSPNLLALTANGDLVADSAIVNGAEGNDFPFFKPGVGFTIFAQFMAVTPSTTKNGIAFPASGNGGCIIGNRAANNNECAALYIDPSSGVLIATTRYSVVNNVLGGADLRDSTWHRAIWVHDPGRTQASELFVDGSSTGTRANSPADVTTVPGADKLHLAGMGPKSGPQLRFMGFLSFVAGLPGPVGDQSAVRTLATNFMATI